MDLSLPGVPPAAFDGNKVSWSYQEREPTPSSMLLQFLAYLLFSGFLPPFILSISQHLEYLTLDLARGTKATKLSMAY